MKAAKTEDEISGEGEVEPGEVGDVEVGESANLADWGCNDAGGCGVGGRVGISVLVAVDALGHLLVVGVLVEASSFWWLVLVESSTNFGGWCWWLVSSKSYCGIGLGKSLRGFGMFVLPF